ncbi:phospholipase A2 inhibitor CgMIP-I-like isoform X1 [Ambystoma mexicanum]|uniref:Sodefrin-like factor n=1 Tax=Ambystoma mexicanum TaxID=8296 RepID=A0A125S9K9_AMBME|nr:sodefrin precursor-like factor [Ambystoma mexicanum]
MRVFLTATAVLFAMITRGNCLICEQCSNMNTKSCSGFFAPCPYEATHCVKGLENSTVGSNVRLFAYKGCVNPAKQATCGKEVIFRSSQMSLHITRECCDSDSCNSKNIKQAALRSSQTPNGFKCSDCSTDQSSNGCASVTELQCQGNENRCASFMGTASRPGDDVRRYTVLTCATKDACEVGISSMEGTHVYNFNLECSDPIIA